MNMKRIPLYITLALCGSLTIGCASQEGSDDKEKQSAIQVTEQETPIEQIIRAHETESAPVSTPVNEVAPQVTPTTVAATSEEIELPEESVVYFGFNKTDIDDKYIELLGEHAEFLKVNTGVTALVEGHTDFHGPRHYNEQLSKKRAEAVAKVLIEHGVPQSQLVITAQADAKPMECKGDTRHNRRVELHYKESSLASSQ